MSSAEQVKDLSGKPYVARELMLIKVRCNATQRRELDNLADIFHGTVCDVSLTTITLELQGKEDKMHALQGLLEPYGESSKIVDHVPGAKKYYGLTSPMCLHPMSCRSPSSQGTGDVSIAQLDTCTTSEILLKLAL